MDLVHHAVKASTGRGLSSHHLYMPCRQLLGPGALELGHPHLYAPLAKGLPGGVALCILVHFL